MARPLLFIPSEYVLLCTADSAPFGLFVAVLASSFSSALEPLVEPGFDSAFEATLDPDFVSSFDPDFDLTFDPEVDSTFDREFEPACGSTFDPESEPVAKVLEPESEPVSEVLEGSTPDFLLSFLLLPAPDMVSSFLDLLLATLVVLELFSVFVMDEMSELLNLD